MDADVMEKEKVLFPAEPERSPGHVVTAEEDLPGAVKPPPIPRLSHALQLRRLQQEAEAREKKLLAELEERYEQLYRKFEESFAKKEKKLLEDLQASHLAECRRLEQAAADREHALLVRLRYARRQLFVAIVAAVLSIAAILNFRARPKDAVQPVLPPSGSDQVPAPQSAGALSSAPTVSATAPAFDPSLVLAPDRPIFVQALSEVTPAAAAKAEPTVAPAAPVAAVKKGNGGNFSGGNLYGK